MDASVMDGQRKAILNSITQTYPEKQWRYVIADSESLALIDRLVSRDEIIRQNVAGVEELESRRSPHCDMEAIYFLTPKPHILECLLSEFKRPKPRHIGGHIIWVGFPNEVIRSRFARQAAMSRNWVLSEGVVPIDFVAQESHLVTCHNPSSTQMLYNPKCDGLYLPHIEELAEKIVAFCVINEEYPIIRYHNDGNSVRRTGKLCMSLAEAVQQKLDRYVSDRQASGSSFPSDSSRPRSVLFVMDRSMDLMAPLVHEFTYQAMAHDLLPLQNENGRVTYIPDATDPKKKHLDEKDEVWGKLRHMQIIDCIRTVREDFDKFKREHPEFQTEQGQTSVFDLKSMMASLPQYSAMKESYELHLKLTGECMGIFQKHALDDVADIEQTLVTGFESWGRAYDPTTVLERLVQTLDDPSTSGANIRLRLIMLFVLHARGNVSEDVEVSLKAWYKERDGFVPDWLLDPASPLLDSSPPRRPLAPRIPSGGPTMLSDIFGESPQFLQSQPSVNKEPSPRPPQRSNVAMQTAAGGLFPPWERTRRTVPETQSRSDVATGELYFERLMRHGHVSKDYLAAIGNLELLGGPSLNGRTPSGRVPPGPFYGSTQSISVPEGMELSRFQPRMKLLLEEHTRGTLDLDTFPFVDPAAQEEAAAAAASTMQTSLQTTKPTWTKQHTGRPKPPQRVIVFMAGGASYNESRVCHELSGSLDRDIILVTSHMLTPDSFIEQLSTLREDRSLLSLEADEAPPKAPSHLFDPDPNPSNPQSRHFEPGPTPPKPPPRYFQPGPAPSRPPRRP